MTEELLDIRNLCGVPVVGKHSIGIYGVNYHNVVEVHFWELDTQDVAKIAVFMREWVGESPRGIGKNLMRVWCPYNIPDMDQFLFHARVEDRDPIFLHPSEFEIPNGDTWGKCTHDANRWTRMGRVSPRLSSRLEACGSDIVLMHQPLAKLLWEKLYGWGEATLPNFCVRSNGTMTTMKESNAAWERLTKKLDVEQVFATNVDRVAKARDFLANNSGVFNDSAPDFRSPKIPVNWVDKNTVKYEKYANRVKQIQQDKHTKTEQYQELMKTIDEFIKNGNANVKTDNYALDA